MDPHTRHIAPTRRRERKTVFADSRWKLSYILSCSAGERQANIDNEGSRKYEAVYRDNR